jgi:tetratricopeptide (TPR) repeat protein
MAGSLDEAERLFAEGEALADQERDGEALARFEAAWAALPDPKEDQEPAVRVLAAVADCRFVLGDWAGCRDAIQDAFECGADLANPLLRLRLGQSLYELGDEREAANWLVLPYLGEGDGLFDGEDPKYLDFVKARLGR